MNVGVLNSLGDTWAIGPPLCSVSLAAEVHPPGNAVPVLVSWLTFPLGGLCRSTGLEKKDAELCRC